MMPARPWDFASAIRFDVVIFRALSPPPVSVLIATHARTTRMISGKSALRKKRFKRPHSERSSTASRERPALLPQKGVFTASEAFWDEIRMQDRDVRKIAVALGEVEPVADDEAVRDLEADVPDVDVVLAPLGLGEQRADVERCRLAGLEAAHEVRQRQARVDDVLDHEHVSALDVDVEVLEDPHDPRGVRRRAVARDRHEVDLAGHGQAPHQIRHEEHRALEHADQQQVAPRVVGRDLAAELRDAVLQPVVVDQYLLDPALELGLAHDPSLRAWMPGASTRPGTATTSSPRTTSGHASRWERGIFASTNTSWIFLLRPASRSPGRHPRTLRPFSSEAMRQAPQSTSPSSATGERSSQTRSYSRTTATPPPRSSRLDAMGASSSSATSGGIVRRSARWARFASARGSSCRSSGRICARISPRFVSGFDVSTRNGTSSRRRYSSPSARDRPTRGRTIP